MSCSAGRSRCSGEFEGPLINYADHRLSVRAIKIQADGALSRGAALLEPYADEPTTSGLMTTRPEELYAQTAAASRAGFQTCIHAIGDRANRVVLDTFERVQSERQARETCACVTSTRRSSMLPTFRVLPSSM